MVTRRIQRVGAYRSGLEATLAAQLERAGVAFEYEPRDKRVSYDKFTSHKYHPDFVLPNGVIVEAKGRFTKADRDKHLLIKLQVPDVEVRFVFSRSSSPIYKGSPTTYADWCCRHGFKFADKLIPEEWYTCS